MPTDAAIDAAVISNITPQWAKVATVAAKSMDQLDLLPTDESFEMVCRRIEALVDSRKIDAQGDISMPRHSEVRALGRKPDA